jgi:hypothetical protein
MKVDQQPYGYLAQSHAGQKLRFVNWIDRFNTLHFDKNQVFNDLLFD